MKKKMTTAFMIICGAALLIAPATAQHRDDSIEESWDRAAREKAQQEQQQEQYRWQTQQQTQQQAPPPASIQTTRWPHLPANPAASDFYKANAALIDSLDNMYCVSSSYIRTLRNRNDAARPTMTAPPPAPQTEKNNGDKFSYEKESWKQDEQKTEPAPPPVPDRGTQELQTLNQELFQLLDKCLNR